MKSNELLESFIDYYHRRDNTNIGFWQLLERWLQETDVGIGFYSSNFSKRELLDMAQNDPDRFLSELTDIGSINDEGDDPASYDIPNASEMPSGNNSSPRRSSTGNRYAPDMSRME